MRNRLLILVFCSALLAWAPVQAAPRYVTDQFKVMLRTGESSTNKILRMLPSGTQVEQLKSNSETGYSQVRLPDGTVGYILTHQLMSEPSARDRLAEVEARLKELQGDPDQLGSRLATVQAAYDQLKVDHAQLQQAKGEIEQELEGIRRMAADSIRVAKERTELRASLADLTRQLEELKMENQDLANQSIRDWFLIGAGVTVLGILIGLILPRLRIQRRRDSWGSL